jgi:COP9 signalosome complex subunit 3
MAQQPSSGLVSLDSIINHATTNSNPVALNATIRNNLSKEVRDTIFAGPMAGGQDPLSILDMRVNSLLVLYILSVFFFAPTLSDPPWSSSFLTGFFSF